MGAKLRFGLLVIKRMMKKLGLFSLTNQLTLAGIAVIMVNMVLMAGLVYQAALTADLTLAMALGIAVIFTLAMVTIAWVIWFTQRVIRPIQHLTAAVVDIKSGQGQVTACRPEELGGLVGLFNDMAARIRELNELLAQQKISHAHQLELVELVSYRLSSVLNSEELLVESVNQIKEKFGFDDVRIYLDEANKQ